MSEHSQFATAINCMDGRVQLPVINWIKNTYLVDFVDTITEPGPNKILAEHKNSNLIESIKNRVNISVVKHKSKLIAVIGHHDCAGNPVDKEIQAIHILAAIKFVDSWNLDIPVIGLWVDENWGVREIK